MGSFCHIPVMREETVDFLNCDHFKTIVDCTVGGAGHAGLIAERLSPGGRLIGIDRDEAALQAAEQVLAGSLERLHLVRDNYVNLPRILEDLDIAGVDGVLLDLGLSFYQIDASGRGFTFAKDEPLDMRMDIRQTVTARTLINDKSEQQLIRIFKEYGEERYATGIARRIVKERKQRAIDSSGKLADLVRGAYPPGARHKAKIHPATKVFMALRMAVNQELENLTAFLDTVPDCLNSGARLCFLSFHSLEDRLVKQYIRYWEASCLCPPDFPVCRCDKQKQCRRITKKVRTPTAAEVAANPMARSTKLRVAEKL